MKRFVDTSPAALVLMSAVRALWAYENDIAAAAGFSATAQLAGLGNERRMDEEGCRASEAARKALVWPKSATGFGAHSAAVLMSWGEAYMTIAGVDHGDMKCTVMTTAYELQAVEQQVLELHQKACLGGRNSRKLSDALNRVRETHYELYAKLGVPEGIVLTMMAERHTRVCPLCS